MRDKALAEAVRRMRYVITGGGRLSSSWGLMIMKVVALWLVMVADKFRSRLNFICIHRYLYHGPDHLPTGLNAPHASLTREWANKGRNIQRKQRSPALGHQYDMDPLVPRTYLSDKHKPTFNSLQKPERSPFIQFNKMEAGPSVRTRNRYHHR